MNRPRVFGGIAAFFGGAAAFHGVALVRPEVAEPSPPWRHGLFAVVNLVVAVGLLRRPRVFVALFTLLTAQQLYSHGSYAASVWRDERRVDWASAVVLAAMPMVLALLVADLRARRDAREGVR